MEKSDIDTGDGYSRSTREVLFCRYLNHDGGRVLLEALRQQNLLRLKRYLISARREHGPLLFRAPHLVDAITRFSSMGMFDFHNEESEDAAEEDPDTQGNGAAEGS